MLDRLATVLAEAAECNRAECPQGKCLCLEQAKAVVRNYILQRRQILRYPPYTEEDDTYLMDRHLAGVDVRTIAKAMKRGRASVYRRRIYLERTVGMPVKRQAWISATKRRVQLMKFITEFWADKGFAPSYDEMCWHMGYKSKSGCHGLVRRLVIDGLLTTTPGADRSVRPVFPRPDVNLQNATIM